MAVVPYWYKVHHGTGVAVRALLNDVLFYRHSGSENWTVSAPANALFVPGENILRIEILPTIVPAHSPGIRGPVEVKVMLDDDTDAVAAMCRWEWSNPNKEPPLPTANFTVFRPSGDIAEPPWMRAPKERFGPEGTPELRDAVKKIYEAFVKRDIGAYMDANSLKMQTWQRAFPDNRHYDAAPLRAQLAANFQKEWIVPPLDYDALIFESQADGRVAYVKRADGGKAIEATAKEQDPKGMQDGFATDLWLTQVDGVWKVFR